MPRHGEKGIEELMIAPLSGCDPNGVHLTPSKLVSGGTDGNFSACYNKRGKVSAGGGMPLIESDLYALHGYACNPTPATSLWVRLFVNSKPLWQNT